MPFVRGEGSVKNAFTATQPLSSAATYSDPINIEHSGYFGVWASGGAAAATSAAQLCLWYELSYDDTLTNFVYVDAVFSNWNGLSGLASGASIAPYPMPWIRLGLSATAATVTSAARVTVKLFEQG